MRGAPSGTGSPNRLSVSWAGFFGGLDRVLHRYENGPARVAPAAAVRRAALRRCAEWIIARQEADGCWGGIQPPWVYSLIALHSLGYGLDHPVMRRGLAGLERFVITEDTPDGPVRRLEACQSPVWDTVLSMIALADAGLPADDPALVRAARWVLAEEVPGPGDWQVRRPRLSPAAGRSSSTTTATRTSTTPRSRCSRCAEPCRTRTAQPVPMSPMSLVGSVGQTQRRRCAARCAGSRACSHATAAGARSTPTTRGNCARSSPSAISVR